jgi:hypothetical protein
MQLLKKFNKDLAINFGAETFEFTINKAGKRVGLPGVKINL